MTDLPSGWTTVSLAEAGGGGLFRDGDWVESKDQDAAGTVRLTQLADIGIGWFRDRSNRWMRPDQAERLGCTFLHPMDILIARMPEPLGRACVVPESVGAAVTAVDVSILRVRRPDLDPRFVMWSLNSPRVRQEMVALQSGTTRKRISRKNLSRIRITLPPLEEQRRIVDILESHLSHLDAASDYVEAAQHRVATLIASVVATATTGADPVPLGSLAVASGYGTSVKCVVGGPGPAVVRIPNLVDGRIDLSDEKRVADPSVDVSRSQLDPDDLLIVRTNGSRDLIGRCSVVQPGIDAAFASYLIRYRFDGTRALPEWVRLVLASPASRARLETLAASSAGQYNLSLSKLDRMPVPLPSIEQQQHAVRRVDDIVADIRRLGRAAGVAAARVNGLRRALLEAAFSGRLAGSSSDDEKVKEMAGV